MENRGVRKGAWTKDEDILLRNCIEKYGEGSWHKVPLRAGLNRCRKSCRLRWLNYLRPNLKRGCFAKDEVELIVRLHKLLGNRWSLIAGRLPGRTANDVKNFWNSHIAKNLLATGKCCKQKSTQRTITTTNIIKPRPRTLTISKLHLPICPNEVTKTNDPNDENLKNKQPSSSAMSSQEEQNDWKNIDENTKNNETTTFISREIVDECIQWWSSLLQISENGEEILCPFSDDDALCGLPKSHADIDGLMDRSSIDVDVWELSSYDHQ